MVVMVFAAEATVRLTEVAMGVVWLRSGLVLAVTVAEATGMLTLRFGLAGAVIVGCNRGADVEEYFGRGGHRGRGNGGTAVEVGFDRDGNCGGNGSVEVGFDEGCL